jgi:hypothetical protein
MRAGETPNPEEFIAAYDGPNKDVFAENLYFAIFMEKVTKSARESLDQELTPDEIKAAIDSTWERIKPRLAELRAKKGSKT